MGGRNSNNDMAKLRRRMELAGEMVPDETVAPNEVLEEDQETIAEKVALAKYRRGIVRRTLRRFKRCRTAQDVFAENALDAAKATVLEMQLAYTSGDRQRAAESVLNRALGKPVDRIMSIGMQVSSKSDAELDHDINRLLSELGFQAGQRAARPALTSGEGKQGDFEAEELSPQSGIEWREGVPRKIYTIDSEG